VEVALLKAISAFYLIQAPEAQARYTKQRQVINELVEMILQSGASVIDTVFLNDWHESSENRLRVVIDQVASLTDPAAHALHARLSS